MADKYSYDMCIVSSSTRTFRFTFVNSTVVMICLIQCCGSDRVTSPMTHARSSFRKDFEINFYEREVIYDTVAVNVNLTWSNIPFYIIVQTTLLQNSKHNEA